MAAVHEGRGFDRPRKFAPRRGPAPERRAFGEPLPAGHVTYPLITRSGVELSVTLSLDPIYSLGKGRAVAARVRETVRYGQSGRRLEPTERPRLHLIDVERMDCEAYHRGMKLLEVAGAPVGVISTSYRTLARAAGRYEIGRAHV